MPTTSTSPESTSPVKSPEPPAARFGWRTPALARRLTLLLFLSGASLPSHGRADGTSSRVLSARRITTPPAVDGDIGDAEWKDAAHAQVFYDPVTGAPAAEQTDAWLAYDDKALYLAFHCRDSRPESIVAREVRYGANLSDDDTVTFAIDPYFSRSPGGLSLFIVNAAGTQADRIPTGRAAKREWRGVWQAAAKRVPDGWSAEMRIPWSVLNYPSRTDATMGINFQRFHARSRVASAWSNLTETGRPEYIGQWRHVVPPKSAIRKPLQEIAYVSPDWSAGGRADVRAGVDLRYRPNAAMTGVLSAFPDLRNIERAVEGIQFTRSERFVGDTRPFFVEGRRFFPFLFYSPRIGDFDVGVKAFGKVDSRLSFGVLAVERAFADGAGVGNVRYALAEHGALNLFGTLRQGPGSDHDGFGGSVSLASGLWSMNAQTARAREGSACGSTRTIGLSYSARRFSFDLGAGSTDRGYSPSLGFVPFKDERDLGFFSEYHAEYRHGPLRDLTFGLSGETTTHQDGTFFQDGASLFARLSTRKDYAFGINRHAGRFESSHDNTSDLSMTGCASNRRRTWTLDYEWGLLNDHSVGQWIFGITRRVFRRLDVSLSGTVLHHAEDQTQLIGTVGWEIDPRRSINGRLVRQDGALNWYMAFRNTGGLGQDLFVIVGDPNAPRFTGRVAIKWVWAN